MVIVNYRAGQLANRLIHFSHFIANSKAFGYKLVYPFFQEYREFFEFGDPDFEEGRIQLDYPVGLLFIYRKIQQLIRSLEKRGKRVSSVFFREFHILSKNSLEDPFFNMRDPLFTAKACHKVLITNGWLYRDEESFGLYANEIRNIFTLKNHYRELVRKQIEESRKNADILIGVHIRRGDYKDFNYGSWYYEDEVYLKNMKSIEAFYKKNGKVCNFFIASNEKVPLKNFSGLNAKWEERHFIIDLYSLASCDYIIGPPSTYSGWAAFFGKVPLFHIESADSTIDERNITRFTPLS
ncbi:alpha-1,2-fucosyltransferase [Pararcticibacter amylolyticus]|uniref:Alpha-1,2-fucosyltransferase n=1 Tax=Pararcticibacter amylolyticus TaxID=2173175 RepID=A0A2U2PI27_9SPHI|nr:alpha-1,2-fucosyltransferase [Pararcticibacter amylolyticus]PWG81066.1 hypothetical protein DDR33_09070 [Pararcticibacter amylolyticus]